MSTSSEKPAGTKTALSVKCCVRLIFSTMLFFGAALVCNAQDVESQSFQAARKVAVDRDLDTIVLVHGSDWNPYGEKLRKECWESDLFRGAVSDLAELARIDVMENPTQEETIDYARRSKGFPVKKMQSYPAIYLFDRQGRHYASLYGDSLPSDAAGFANAVVARLQARRERDRLWDQAKDTADVAEKTQLLFSAYQLGVGNRDQFKKAIKNADPNDTQGFLSRINFDGPALVRQSLKLTKDGKSAQSLSMLDAHLENEHLQPTQRQWVLLAKVNSYRHIPGSKEKMLEIANESEGISVTTIPGRAIKVIVDRFARPRKK